MSSSSDSQMISARPIRFAAGMKPTGREPSGER